MIHRNQRGLALLVAMIVLVVMSIAGIALIRSVDTGVLIAGNLAFRQSASHSGDAGIEAARTWLLANTASLSNDSPSNGYYANSQASLDLTGNKTTATSDDVAWNGTGVSTPRCLATDSIGNTVCFIIHRMCDTSGTSLDAATCTTKTGALGGSGQGANRQMTTYQEGSWTSTTAFGYYRVTVRVAGPRNNFAFVQAFLII